MATAVEIPVPFSRVSFFQGSAQGRKGRWPFKGLNYLRLGSSNRKEEVYALAREGEVREGQNEHGRVMV